MFWVLGAPWGVPGVCELGPEHQLLVKKKLRLRGLDPPGEIRAEILCKMAAEM